MLLWRCLLFTTPIACQNKSYFFKYFCHFFHFSYYLVIFMSGRVIIETFNCTFFSCNFIKIRSYKDFLNSIISIDSSITDNIVRKIINVLQEKSRSKNRTLRTTTFTGYACEDFPSRTTRIPLLLRKEEIRPKARLKFVKKNISMPNPVKSLGYIKCHNLSSPRPVKSSSNSIRYNCEKISSWSRRPKTILEIRKKTAFLHVINNPIIFLWRL